MEPTKEDYLQATIELLELDNTTLRQQLDEAVGLISTFSLGFIERQTDESGTWDVCNYCHCIAEPDKEITHAGNCVVPRLTDFLTRLKAEGRDIGWLEIAPPLKAVEVAPAPESELAFNMSWFAGE